MSIIAFVQSALSSGMEGRIPDDIYSTASDKIALRAMSRGLGLWGLSEHESGERRRWSSQRLKKHWRILPTAQELKAGASCDSRRHGGRRLD
eukprot:9111582-Pyramimonas_sp.AAC.1